MAENTINKWFDLNVILDKNFHNLIRNISDKKEIKKIFWQWIKDVALFLDRESAIRTPVDTWVLRSKQRAFIKKWFKSTIRNSVWYWLFVHEWTKYQRSQPWMKNSIDENKKEINTTFNRWIEIYFNNLTK